MGVLASAAWSCIFSVLLSYGTAQTATEGPSKTPAIKGDQQLVPEILQQVLSIFQSNPSLSIPVQEILQGIPVRLLSLQGQLQNPLARLTNGVSPLCVNQTLYMMKSLQSPWAAAMLDSFGRQPAGVLEGNLKWLGDFKECVRAKTEIDSPMQIHGSYCKFPLPLMAGSTQVIATVGGCFPNGCSSSDLRTFMVSVIEEVIKINRTDKFLAGFYVDCERESRPLTTGAIIAIVICSVFGAAILVGTMYDVSNDAHSCLLENFCGTEAKRKDQEEGYVETQLRQLSTTAASGVNSSDVQLVDQMAPIGGNGKGSSSDTNEPQSLQSSNGRCEQTFNKDGSQMEHPEQESKAVHPWQAKGSVNKGSTPRTGLLGRFILCFSIYTNGRKLLLSSTQGDSTLSCVHGIRFLSMCWVVLGHTYIFSASILSDTGTFLRDTAQRKSFQAISNASFSVDTFFLLSSLLVVYLMLKELEKRNGRLTARQWIFIYVHRYLRLTGVYAVILMIWICLTTYMYEGPQWWKDDNPDPACTDKWWTNLIYVNNFVEMQPGLSCMGWTWYLANDMQMFLVTPIITFIIYHIPYLGIGITVLLTLSSIVSSVVIAKDVNYTNSLVMGFLDTGRVLDIQSKHYIKPWNRFQAYGVGIILAFLIYKLKGKYTIPKVLALIGWIIASGSALAALYGPYEMMAGSKQLTHTVNEAAMYAGLSRFAWTIGVAWVIYVCSTGQGGWVQQLLSWKPFVPLGRLCYCAYLVHPILMLIIQQGSRDMIHSDDVTMAVLFLGELSLILAVAFVTSLAFEAPLLRAEKLALGGDS